MVAPGYGVATPPPPRGRSFERRHAAGGPAAVPGTPELACGSFLQAMQEAAASAPLVAQPFHQQRAVQAQPAAAAAGPCVFSSWVDWEEVLPDELLAP